MNMTEISFHSFGSALLNVLLFQLNETQLTLSFSSNCRQFWNEERFKDYLLEGSKREKKLKTSLSWQLENVAYDSQGRGKLA